MIYILSIMFITLAITTVLLTKAKKETEHTLQLMNNRRANND